MTGAVFQQKSGDEPQFLQIVAKDGTATPNKSKPKAEPKLTRVAFKVSRLMEFCTLKELVNQTGHSVYDWALVVLKELMDNALDACEEVEVAPVISIDVKGGSITIQDNAGGIDTATIKSILDYTIRVSSREAYCSPTRGAQGNALKTILAMAFVLQREVINEDNPEADAAGVTIIETRGLKHRIEFSVDHINNQPKIAHDISPSSITVGTKVTVEWPPLWEWSHTAFKSLARSYAWVNRIWLCGERSMAKSSSMSPQRTRLGKNGSRAIRPLRIGIVRHGCNVISPPMWRGTSI